MSPAIIATNLCKTYQGKPAVSQLNLSIREGELFALLGMNGAGKTTTIKMLSCLVSPTSGDALLLGDSIVSNPFAVKAKINVSPQETAVARNLTVKENLELIGGLYGLEGKSLQGRVTELLSTFRLDTVARDKAKVLSGGLQRRLSIAMALISDPKILFLDEPTLGLDVLARRELWAAIRTMKGKVTIILTTHYLEEAEALADRVGVMARGQLKAVGTVAELLAQTSEVKFEEAFIKLATEEELAG